MDEISMFKVLRPASPAATEELSQVVGDRLDEALAQAPDAAPGRVRHGRVRHGRLVLAGGLSLAIATAAVAIAVAGQGGSVPASGPGGPLPGTAVRELAYRTAAVAAAQPEVRPGQWVYWKEKQLGGKLDGIFQVWTTADSRRAAYVDDKGKVQYIDRCAGIPAGTGHRICRQSAGFIGQPAPFAAPHDTSIGGVTGAIPVSYAGLRALPRTPRALVAYLGGLQFPHWAGWGPAPVREFSIIEQMLTTYVMRPALTAELYKSLAVIPGVTIDHHAVDVAGRRGLGLLIAIPPAFGGGIDEIIINPRTYQLAGQQLLYMPHGGSANRVLSGTAILQSSPVSGPGQLP
jgi:hypothetical protein